MGRGGGSGSGWRWRRPCATEEGVRGATTAQHSQSPLTRRPGRRCRARQQTSPGWEESFRLKTKGRRGKGFSLVYSHCGRWSQKRTPVHTRSHRRKRPDTSYPNKRTHDSRTLARNSHLSGTQTQKQTKSWRQAPEHPLGHVNLATSAHLHLALDTNTDLPPTRSPTHAAPSAESQSLRALPGITITTSQHDTPKQSPAPRPWPGTPAPQTSQNLTSPRPLAGPRTPNLRTQHSGARGAGLGGDSTRGSAEGGGPRDSASGGWCGSGSGSRGQRAPRPQARRAPAPRHPPASLAPAPDSCTDMKRGPRTPMKPAPAN